MFLTLFFDRPNIQQTTIISNCDHQKLKKRVTTVYGMFRKLWNKKVFYSLHYVYLKSFTFYSQYGKK